MERKYELTDETKEIDGRILHRIVATKDFYYGDGDRISIVRKGDLGGFIESEENLSHDGGSWVMNNAWVFGNARVSGNAQVFGNACVSGNAHVCGNAWVYGDALISGNAQVSGNAHVCGNAFITSLDDISTISGFGSENRTTTFYLSKDNEILVYCGCFHGALKQFRDKVKITHGDSKLAKEYLMIADLMEMRFNRVLEK